MRRLIPEIGPDDQQTGPDDAPLQLVEYGDYECPFCGAAYREVKQVQRTLGSKLQFVFRNFPLTQVHPHALEAAEAALAAGAQGRFWEMHDLLFENAGALDLESLQGYASKLGLDLGQFDRELQEHRWELRVRSDVMSGVRSGVNGTPTFFVEGVRHDGPATSASLLEALQGSPLTAGL